VCRVACFCCHDVAYDGGACGREVGVVTEVEDDEGAEGATAVCRIGFWTCVDLTECMMIGCCVFV
jgi:hypothetical protein